MSENVLLIDGHSMINRAFYGVPPLTNSAGLHTNAIYGFFNILFSVMDDIKPEYILVAFDLKAPTFRHKMYKEYKGTRKPMPEELREQVPVVKDILAAMNIPVMTQEGYEADDILGTMARRAEGAGKAVTILSGDRDLLQLATEKVRIRMPHTKGGKTEVEDFYAANVLERYQVTPAGIIELKALMGDASDNIPGVPKVGEKTATQLVVEYGNIENLKLHLDEITKKALKATLTENFELAELSKVLATIDTNADIPFDIESGRIGNIFTKEAYELFKMAEFKNMLSRFDSEAVKTVREETDYFTIVTEFTKAEEIFAKALECGKAALYMLGEKQGKESLLAGVSITLSQKEIYYIPAEGFLTDAYLLDKVRNLYANADVTITSFGIKEQLKYFASAGIESPQHREGIYDLKIAAYLLNPNMSEYLLDSMAMEYAGISVPGRKEIFGKKTLFEARDTDEEALTAYACDMSYICYRIADEVISRVDENGMLELYKDLEMPLLFVLNDMENEGVKVKREELKKYGEALTGRIEELERAIHDAAGCEFNINSPKQLGDVLFEKLNMPGGKKTKTGYSTAADVLEKLSVEYPIVNDILEYRALTKLKSTYAEGLYDYIDEGERIHSTFHQTITATGRLSSADPNLQNIPIRTEIGRQLRKIFVAKEGYVLVDADYSQIELRILASLSGDEKLIDAYGQEQDIHRITASQVFGVPIDEVTDTLRRNAKAVNFGIVYGISSFGLGNDLSISKKEAQQYIDNYFMTYPGVKNYLDSLVRDAKDRGYVVTKYGRKRPVPELSSGNFMQRQFGERVAMNAPIQGTAADIMKRAMLAVSRRLKSEHMKSKLILQVHDELLIETAVEEQEKVMELLREEMMGAADLAVALETEVKTGQNWYEAH